MKSRLGLIALVVLVMSMGLFASARAATESSISVSISPSSPAPFEDVSIALQSFSSNLDTVLISWSVDGKTVSSGIGKKSFRMNAPAGGQESTVIATVSLPDGSIDKRMIIRPAEMVILWQANDSHTPPFYKGRALPTRESEIKIVALPEISSGGKMVSHKNLTYSWKKDQTNEVNGSGYGKNYFLYVHDYLDKTNNISVTAETIDQGYSSQASIDVAMSEPRVLFYRNDLELGTIWAHALAGSFTVQGDEIIRAVPYFVSPKEIDNPRSDWSWYINGSRVPVSLQTRNMLPVRTQDGVSGTSRLKLQIDNRDKLFQSISGEVNVGF